MTQSQTTSIRLPSKLRDQLEDASHTLHRGKNSIIVQAIEEYLEKHNKKKITEEARRQSLLACKNQENDTWEDDTDTSGWI